MTARTESGFTLIEVLIALAIAVLALAVMYASVQTAMNNTQAAAKYAEAISRARSHLAAIDENAPTLVGVSEGDDGGGFHWKLQVKPVSSVPSNLALYQIIVAISWGQDKVTRHVQLETRRLAAKPSSE